MDNVTADMVKAEKALLARLVDPDCWNATTLQAVGTALHAIAHRRVAMALDDLPRSLDKIALELGGLGKVVSEIAEALEGDDS